MADFLRRQWLWIVLLLSLNWGAWYAFEVNHPRELGESDLWPVRMYLLSGLLLFDNLCVLWWYAYSTRQLVEASREQVKAAQGEAGRAELRYQESQRQLLVSLKPLVSVERVEDPDRPGWAAYRLRNAGGGPAINVYYIGLLDMVFQGPRALGSVGPGMSRALPAHIAETLREGHGGVTFLLLAEALYTRTTQWVPTLCRRTQTTGSHGGEVLYSTGEAEVEPPRFQHQDLDTYMNNNRGTLAAQLVTLARREDAR